MSFVAAAIAASAVVAGAATSANAADNAAAAGMDAARAASGAQGTQNAITRQDQLPWTQAGGAGVTTLAKLLGLGGMKTREQILTELTRANSIFGEAKGGGYTYSDGTRGSTPSKFKPGITAEQLQKQADDIYGSQEADTENAPLLRKFTAEDMQADPVYQSGLEFGLREGTGGINARALAGGGYDSGATLKALTRFGNDYGSTKANESYNRFNNDQSNVFNRLSGIAGTGQQAVNQVQAAGTNYANQTSAALMDGGNARASGIVGGANAWNNALGQGVNMYGNYQSNQTLQRLLAGRSGSPTSNFYYTGETSAGGNQYG